MNLVALKAIPSSVAMIDAGQAFRVHDPEHAQSLVRSGHARWQNEPPEWGGIHWPGASVVILASGASLTLAQCEQVQVWRESAGAAARRCIVINTTFERAPWADVLYACDAPWWRKYHAQVQQQFGGALWTQDKEATREFGVRWIESRRAPGLGKTPGLIHQGGNGGYQAINLAYQAGAAKLILLGYDMHGTHWHGRYENGLPNTSPHLFKTWVEGFAALAADLEREGVEVVNCTPGSALTCFTMASLSETIEGTTA